MPVLLRRGNIWLLLVDRECHLGDMTEHEKNDPAYCRRRAGDFRAKAKAATGWLMKQALQAAAHEYELRAVALDRPRAVAQAAFPARRTKIG